MLHSCVCVLFQRFIQFLASNNVAFTLDNFNDNSSTIGQLTLLTYLFSYLYEPLN